jgi:hypothetical protein
MRKAFSHERNVDGKDEWLTPRSITDALGPFDLDPCSPINRPWDTASRYYTQLDDGLENEWTGRVWCNPPYGKETGKWLRKLSNHGNGIALVFARTETKAFFDNVWGLADGIFFFKGRIKFCHVSGEVADAAGAPSCLIAYGKVNAESIKTAQSEGKIYGKLILL